ncbi:acyltransferase family protein [Macrococcus animalis]|uniref:acyltransferase family protein n=1 Tax=Macrococcus animalis TaxID=3395467 RepID=UPI0039BE3707
MKKYYIDNMKSFVIILVVIFHVIASFSSNNSVLNYHAEGIPWFDAIGYLLYPWFMILMFIISGMTAHYSLRKRTSNQFMVDRIKFVLIPFIIFQLTFGAITSWFSFEVNNMVDKLSELPDSVINVIRVMNGMGPSWYLLQLFITSFIFWLVLKFINLEKYRDKLSSLNILVIILLVIPIFISAQYGYILYTFRFFLYTLAFFLGYLIFSNEEILSLLSKHSIMLSICSIVLGIIQMTMYWGKSYMVIVNEPMVVLFSWFSVLAVLGLFYKYVNSTNQTAIFLSQYSYGIYLFHFLPLTIGAYLIDIFHVHLYLRYFILLLFTFIFSILFTFMIKNIPLVSKLFGFK